MACKYSQHHGGNYDKGTFERGGDVPRGRFQETGRFGRMMPYLRSLTEFKPGPNALGAVGGVMDGGAAADPSQDNPRIKAGYTFLGQFIDHDLTLDATSTLEQQIDPQATRNFRTPALELDSVYGLGPKVQPYLYDQARPGKMLLGATDHDLPRNSQGVALIGDPRNDENVIIAQLHLLFLKFHNKIFDVATDPSMGWESRYEKAQSLARWHYQWLVVNEFLTRTVGRKLTERAIAQLPFRYPDYSYPFMPVEFSVAAYRFGHSQVRPGYRLSEAPFGDPAARVAALFPNNPEAPNPPENVGDLRGGRPIHNDLRIEWAAFFGTSAQPGKLVDIRLATPLLRLPDSVVGPGMPEERRSLVIRNLQRGIDARLPSGQSVAAHLRVSRRLTEEQIWKDVPGGEGPAPLWFYCLREAETLANGLLLAGAGARIVAHTFAAILEADKASYIVQMPDWTPTLGANGQFSFSDLINFTLGTELVSEDVDSLLGPASS
ncbi:MAG: heme peroxidase family protein [Beijerinckiaceae bacterium]|nr:heme peroxidase family protein [Beijerinckiaceae bacterium]